MIYIFSSSQAYFYNWDVRIDSYSLQTISEIHNTISRVVYNMLYNSPTKLMLYNKIKIHLIKICDIDLVSTAQLDTINSKEILKI